MGMSGDYQIDPSGFVSLPLAGTVKAAGLTPTELQAAIALVRRIHDMGITIVIVEHIMEVIMTLTKRVLVFNQGHVIASGTPASVVKQDAVIEAYLGRAHRRQQDQKSG